MKRVLSQKTRRSLVLLNYLGLAGVLAFFFSGQRLGWGVGVQIGLVASLLLTAGTFAIVFVRTDLWRLVHRRADRLDERELQITHESLRYAYAIFTVMALIVLLVVALDRPDGLGPLGVLVPAAGIYLAHTLPAAVLAWRERHIGDMPEERTV